LKITLIAHTTIDEFPDSIMDTEFYEWSESPRGIAGPDADRLAHFAGRSCYQSWDMPNPETASDEGYLANILKQEHFSVLEHATATFYIEDVSRNLTHELVRHRHLSYSELSQRYVNMDDSIISIPPAIDKNLDLAHWCEMGAHQRNSIELYNNLVDALESTGVKGKKAREAARAILPGGILTKIVVTGNHRAWRDMLHKRYSVHADAEICEFAGEILKQLRKLAPSTYQDFPEAPDA
jgi:thymidylate synthase (FAD)